MKLLQFITLGICVYLFCFTLIDSKKLSKKERLVLTQDVIKIITALNSEMFQEIVSLKTLQKANGDATRNKLCFSSNIQSPNMWKLAKRSKRKVCKQIFRIKNFSEEFTSTCKNRRNFIKLNMNGSICEFFDLSKHIDSLCLTKILTFLGC